MTHVIALDGVNWGRTLGISFAFDAKKKYFNFLKIKFINLKIYLVHKVAEQLMNQLMAACICTKLLDLFHDTKSQDSLIH